MTAHWTQYERTRTGKIIDLPRSHYRVLPDRQPAPSVVVVVVTVLAIAATAFLWAIIG